jgi:adenylate kinase family enzyme
LYLGPIRIIEPAVIASEKTPALLLIGPTGSGKSPLGALLEQRMGWAHFDFGHQLRLIARGEGVGNLTDTERFYVKDLVSKHELFPDDKFHIVEKILVEFLERNNHTPGIILNGLPRHIGQVQGIGKLLDVKNIAVLECSCADSTKRVAARVKGLTNDHAGRTDDTPVAVKKKFALYTEHTAPIIDHFEGIGARVVRVSIEKSASESEIATSIMQCLD